MDTHVDEEHSGNSTSDIGQNIKDILFEIRSQQSELSALKQEVRGNALSVSEVKRLKTEKDIKWRFEGNKKQFEFNSELEDVLKQGLWALQNGKEDYAKEVIADVCSKVHVRNKHIRIADTSEGGWETVNQYECNPLASDSDDESRINRAESRAVRKKKSAQKKPAAKSRPAATYGYSGGVVSGRMWGGPVQRTGGFPFQQSPSTVANPFSFRGYGNQSFQRLGATGYQIGPCFACGESNHVRLNCPHTRGFQQPDAPIKK